MKNRFILILSLVLMVTMCFSSCKRLPQEDVAGAPEQENVNTEAPSEAKKETPEIKEDSGLSAPADTPVKSDGSYEKMEPEAANPGSDGNDPSQSDNIYVAMTTDYVHVSPEELQERAALIFVGEYTGQRETVIPDKAFCEEKYGYFHDFACSDYIFKPLYVAKGDPEDSVRIRREGGAVVDGVTYSCNDLVKFEEGKKYFMYVDIGSPDVPDDNKHYCVITINCFEIDDDGNAVFSRLYAQDEDVPELQAQYEQALAAPVSKEALDK